MNDDLIDTCNLSVDEIGPFTCVDCPYLYGCEYFLCIVIPDLLEELAEYLVQDERKGYDAARVVRNTAANLKGESYVSANDV